MQNYLWGEVANFDYTFQFSTKLCTKCVTGVNCYQVRVI